MYHGSERFTLTKSKHGVQSRDFEWDQQSFIEEKVPSSHEAKSVVNPMASHPDEA